MNASPERPLDVTSRCRTAFWRISDWCWAALLLAGLAAPLGAQARSAGVPVAEWAELPLEIPTLVLETPDVDAYRAEDEARGQRPLRYGAVLRAEAALFEVGRVDAVEGGLTWRLELHSPGAKSLGLVFAEFDLPRGAQLFLYDAQRSVVLGAYTEHNERSDGRFAVEPVPGERVVLEYFEPDWSRGRARLVLDAVIHDYRDIFALMRGDNETQSGTGSGGDGGCTVDANCPVGDPYSLERRSTVRTLSGGVLCSGALVNNTAEDETPYVLTAEHCGQSIDTVFSFNFERPGCNTGTAQNSDTVSGAVVLVSDVDTDHRLLEIASAVPTAFAPVYAGWERATANLVSGVSMHHPNGGPKCISIDSNGGGKSIQQFPGSGSVKVWNMDFQVGGTLDGSSGGPLFDDNGRLRGVLTGGPDGTCSVRYFGRFYNFWLEQPTLAGFLDPLGTGASFLDALDPGGGTGPIAPRIDSVDPASVPALSVDGNPTVTLTGEGLANVTEVVVNGTALGTFPPEFFIQSDTELQFDLRPQAAMGTLDIEVTNFLGSDTSTIEVTPNTGPTLELIGSDPEFLFNAAGLPIYMSGQPGDFFFLLGATSNLPSVLPGIFSADIGNGLLELIYIGAFGVHPVQGWTFLNLPTGNGIPPGLQVFLQGGVLDGTLPELPLEMSNVQSGTVLF